jgi:hypothetical protein
MIQQRDKKPKNYFSSSGSSLSIKDQGSPDQPIARFSLYQNKKLGTYAIYAKLFGFDENYLPASGPDQWRPANNFCPSSTLDTIQKDVSSDNIDQVGQQEDEIYFDETINCQMLESQQGDDRKYRVNSVGNRVPIPVKITKQDVKKDLDSLKFYFSDSSSEDEIKKMINQRSELAITDQRYQGLDSTKMSFVIDQKLYFDSANQKFDQPIAVKFSGFTYSNWRDDFENSRKYFNLNGDLKDFEVKAELKEILSIDLRIAIEQAQIQGKPIPYILNVPAAFISELSDQNKDKIKELIAESLKEVLLESKALVDQHLSEIICLGGDFWEDKINNQRIKEELNIEVHQVDADMIEIAKKLKEKYEIIPVLPMMCNPLAPIGCDGLGERTTTVVDEMMSRKTGNIARAIISGHLKKIATRQVSNLGYFDEKFRHVNKVLYVKNSAKTIDDQDCYFYQLQTGQTSQFKISTKYENKEIETSTIFKMAVEQSVQGLKSFADFRVDESKKNNLIKVMLFAQKFQGVGNKLEQLTNFFKKADGSIDQAMVDDARKFSAKFQQIMKDQYQVFTGNENFTKHVGARLHRMACQENIISFIRDCGHTKDQSSSLYNEINGKFNSKPASLVLRAGVSPNPLLTSPGKDLNV